jgi:hypothetical protein
MIMLSDSFQNREGADSVVLEEHVGVRYASVNMCFRRDINDCIHLMDEPIHKQGVTNVALNESVPLIVLDIMQIRRVSTYAHFVNVYQFIVRMFSKNKPAEVASDKS